MNKNAIIGLLIAVLVVVAVYAAFASNPSTGLVSTNSENTPGNISTNQPNINTPPAAAEKQPSTPIVQTSTEVTISNSTAFVSGKITPNGAQTNYWYDYGLTTVALNHTTKQNIGSGYSAITSPAYITGLKANTAYFFRLNAENAFGVSQGAVYGFTTNATPPAPGKAPTVQTNNTSDVSRTGVNLNGKVNANGYQTAWWFEFGETTSFGNLTTFGSINGGQDLLSVTASVSNLKPLTKYYYRINAQNQYGTVNSSTGSFTTAGPASPDQPTEPSVKTNSATNIGTTSVTLNAQLDPRGANTRFWFEYSRDSLLGSVIGTRTPEQSMGGPEAPIGVKYDVTGLTKNSKYYYRVVASNQYGVVEGTIQSFRTK